MSPSPAAAASEPTLISLSEIPPPPEPESAAGAHSVPSHFNICPVVGETLLTSDNPPIAILELSRLPVSVRSLMSAGILGVPLISPYAPLVATVDRLAEVA